MATGGTGDVLAGVPSAPMMGQGDAGVRGGVLVRLFARAGRRLSARKSAACGR